MLAVHEQHGAEVRTIRPENRREYPRIVEPPLHVSELGLVRDVSLGGLSVFVECRVRQGDTIEVVLTDATSYYTKSMMAEVVWAAGRLAGLRWVDLTEDQKRWLAARFTEWQTPFETILLQPLPSTGTIYRI